MPPPPRLGPRPLPLHLSTALMTWASPESAWPLWMRDSPSSKPGSTAPEALAEVVREVASLGARAGNGRFDEALHREIGRRMDLLAEGMTVYRRHPYHRDLATPPAAWQEGNTRLLDFGQTHAAARKR